MTVPLPTPWQLLQPRVTNTSRPASAPAICGVGAASRTPFVSPATAATGGPGR